MAIAPLEAPHGGRDEERRRLRLVQGGRPAGAGPRGSARHALVDDDELRRARAAHPTARPVPVPPSVARPTERRRRSPASASAGASGVRRRVAGTVVVLAALVALAMPLRALGAVTVDGRSTPGGVPAGLAPGAVYVVQPGDTLRSIAMRINPAIARSLEATLARALGSTTVVPGEHVVIP